MEKLFIDELKRCKGLDGTFIVDSEWVYNHFRLPDYVVIDVSRKEDFLTHKQEDYIDGAIQLFYEELGLNNGPLNSAEDCFNVFHNRGISYEDTLIFYSFRTIVAFRAALVAYWLGFSNIKILDGGLKDWKAHHYPVSKSIESSKKSNEVSPFDRARLRSEAIIQTPQELIAELSKDPSIVLASVRSWDEFIGKIQYYGDKSSVGEIKGAVYAGYEDRLVNSCDQLVSPSYYLEEWKNWGIEKDKRIVFYCGTGWRASVPFFIAKELGWENVSVFIGSWYQYYLSHLEEADLYPIQIGDPRELSK